MQERQWVSTATLSNALRCLSFEIPPKNTVQKVAATGRRRTTVHVSPLAVSAMALVTREVRQLADSRFPALCGQTKLARRLIQILLLAFGRDQSSCLLRTLRLHSMRLERGFGHLEFCAHVPWGGARG